MSRRRRSASGIVTIYWRDIPAQVSANSDAGAEKVLLDDRFQVAIDRAATTAGLTDTHDYVEQWRRVTTPAGPDSRADARARAAELDASFSRSRLEAFVANGGLDPESPASADTNASTEADTQ